MELENYSQVEKVQADRALRYELYRKIDSARGKAVTLNLEHRVTLTLYIGRKEYVEFRKSEDLRFDFDNCTKVICGVPFIEVALPEYFEVKAEL